MKSFTASEASKKFGEILKYAETLPLEITRHGSRQRYVLLSQQVFELYEHLRIAHAEQRVLVTTESALGKLLKGEDASGVKRIRLANTMLKRFLDATGEKV